MAIYRTIPDAEKTEKENQQSEIICAKKQKTYTQEEVLAMLEQEKPKPLTLELETAKAMVLTAVNKAKQECGIPNFIMEGVIADIHSQITSQAKVEMMNDFNLYIEEIKQEHKKKSEEDEKEGGE